MSDPSVDFHDAQLGSKNGIKDPGIKWDLCFFKLSSLSAYPSFHIAVHTSGGCWLNQGETSVVKNPLSYKSDEMHANVVMYVASLTHAEGVVSSRHGDYT